MVVMCDANAILEYDERRSGLPSAPLEKEYGNNITEIPINKNIDY
tara:strand:+ start:251 stop:385 length:135 start_codon:yes stop_codon:yes gene_type:complete